MDVLGVLGVLLLILGFGGTVLVGVITRWDDFRDLYVTLWTVPAMLGTMGGGNLLAAAFLPTDRLLASILFSFSFLAPVLIAVASAIRIVIVRRLYWRWAQEGRGLPASVNQDSMMLWAMRRHKTPRSAGGFMGGQ